jgi:hypothetical protein
MANEIPLTLFHGTTLSAYKKVTKMEGRYRNILGDSHGVYLDTIMDYPIKTAKTIAKTFKTLPLLLIVKTKLADLSFEIHPERDDWYEIDSLNKESYIIKLL